MRRIQERLLGLVRDGQSRRGHASDVGPRAPAPAQGTRLPASERDAYQSAPSLPLSNASPIAGEYTPLPAQLFAGEPVRRPLTRLALRGIEAATTAREVIHDVVGNAPWRTQREALHGVAPPTNYLRTSEPIERALNGAPLFDDPDFWRSVPTQSGDVRKTLRKWYPRLEKEDSRLLARVRKELGKQYVALLLDPGIASRPDAFLAFAAEFLRSHRGASPFALRQAFGERLGATEVYRAVSVPRELASRLRALPPKERRALANDEGLRLCPDLLPERLEVASRLVKGLIDSVLWSELGQGGPLALRQRRLGAAANEANVMASYSAYPELAVGVASQTAPEDFEVVLMKASIPSLSVLPPTGLLAYSNMDPEAFVRVTMDGETFDFPETDPDIEVFTLLHDRGELLSVEVLSPEGISAESLP